MPGFVPLGSAPLGAAVRRERNPVLRALGASLTLTGFPVRRGYGIALAGAALTLTGHPAAAYFIGYARPDGDVDGGGFVTELGAASNLYASLDEASPSDLDYVVSPSLDAGESAALILHLEDLPPSPMPEGHRVQYRFRKDVVAGSRVMRLTVELRQGATVIASRIHNDVGTSYVDGDLELTTGEAAAITDFDDLRLAFIAAGVS